MNCPSDFPIRTSDCLMTITNGEVHQFHSGTAIGDAITDEMLSWQTHLRALGYRSEIFAQYVAAGLEGRVLNVEAYQPSPDDVLFLHHSMGHDALDRLLAMPQRVIAVYHNITPIEFIEEPYVRRFARIGHAQLRQLAGTAVAAIADSNFNRREMLRAGFAAASVVPVKVDFSEFKRSSGSSDRSADWLFVGRVVPSKGQLELVEAFADLLSNVDVGQRLVLVGDNSDREYSERIESLIARRKLSARVLLVGKVSRSELRSAYHSAGIFTSMSKHEGFGVPLLEAMAAGLPVVAYANGAVGETLGGAGRAVPDGVARGVVAVCAALTTDVALRQAVILRQGLRLSGVEAFDIAGALAAVVGEARGAKRLTSVQVQGPFETSYSLAILNRELACALQLIPALDLSIFATEGPGDYVPAELDLVKIPEAAALYRKSGETVTPDVVIRQMYPPRVSDSPGGLTFQYFGWEESRLPDEYVNSFNRHLDGIGVMSTFVKQVLVNSGVTVPVSVVGVGVRHPNLSDAQSIPELSNARSFRFLSISSAFPRKGIDVLLAAYFAEFSGDDDCSLVLKTFPNPHNDVEAILGHLAATTVNPPDVVWINREMSEPEIDGLYAGASTYVHAARGEGFGLPVAEAMSAGVAVIAPDSTGLADFVNESTATTVPSVCAPARTHLSVAGSTWAEPDQEALGQAMRSAFLAPDNPAIGAKIEQARALIHERFSWAAVARRFEAFIAEVQGRYAAPRIDFVSTWNTRCGIAEYTSDLVTAAGQRWDTRLFANRETSIVDPSMEESVERVWIADPQLPIDALVRSLDESSADIVHIQHNFGFFGVAQLALLIRSQQAKRGVVVTLHRTSDLETENLSFRLGDITDELALADRIVVHQEADATRLRALGVERVEVIPIGAPQFGVLSTESARQLLGLDVPTGTSILCTYGFLLPHKGTLELIQAVGLLRKSAVSVVLLVVSALHSDPISPRYLSQCLAEVERLGLSSSVRFITEFLQPNVSHLLVSAADVVVLPYVASEESSSASLRFVLTAGRPVVTTDLGIFGDAAVALELIEQPATSQSIAAALSALLSRPDRQGELGAASRLLASRSSIDRSTEAHNRMYQSIRSERLTPAI